MKSIGTTTGAITLDERSFEMDLQCVRPSAVEAACYRERSQPWTSSSTVLIRAASIVSDGFKIDLAHPAVHQDMCQPKRIALPLEMDITFNDESVTSYRYF
ncbi:hypothetical protein D3D01_16730 [Haloarcula sp. Atlit-7R]|nr:hypothetical protein D3D01_16730 [Haloarcula sp. Atlit-7R]